MTNQPRRLTARQLAAALAKIDAQLDLMRAAVEGFDAFIPENGPVDEVVGAAWNAMHDAFTTMEHHRSEVEANPRPRTASEETTYALVRDNID
jgi:hypothetical protein